MQSQTLTHWAKRVKGDWNKMHGNNFVDDIELKQKITDTYLHLFTQNW